MVHYGAISFRGIRNARFPAHDVVGVECAIAVHGRCAAERVWAVVLGDDCVFIWVFDRITIFVVFVLY